MLGEQSKNDGSFNYKVGVDIIYFYFFCLHILS